MRTARPLLLASLLLAACQGSHSEGAGSVAGADADAVLPALVSLSLRDASGASGPYRLDGLDKLSIEVQLRKARRGTYDVRLSVYSPDGTLYSQLPVQVEVAPRHEGSAVQQIEIGGTTIESLRRTGTWRFEARLTDAGPPLATAEAQVTE